MLNFLFKRPNGIPIPVQVVKPPAPAVPASPAMPAPAVPAAGGVPASAPAVSAPASCKSDAAAIAYRSDHKSLYKQLLRGLYDAVLVTDPKGHVIDSNGRVQDFFQFDKSEVWDMEIGKLIPGVNRQLLDRVRLGLAEDRHVMIGARGIRKDGTSFPAEVAISAIDLMNEGDLIFSVRNVERRKQQTSLLRSLQNALSNDLSSVAVCDREGHVTYASQALRTLWGCEKDEQILGRALPSLWPGDAQGAEPVQKALAGERWMGLLHAAAQDGRAFAVAAAIAADHDADQGVTGLVCSFIEVQDG